MKPKVLAIITQSEMGGAQRFLVQMANGLRNDFDFEIATGSDGNDEIRASLHDFKIHKIQSLKRNISPIDDIKSLFEIKKLILETRPQSIFLMSSKAGFNGALASYLLPPDIRPKVIYRIGGWTFNDPGSFIKKFIFFGLEFISAPLKDIIIVNNLHDFKQAQRLLISPLRSLKLIYNGLNLKDSDYLPSDIARHNFVGGYKGLVIGCIANFYETKGLDILIEALNNIKNIDFRCIIIGDGNLRSELEAQIRRCDLSDRVILVGKKENAYKYLKAFDIYIQPSRKEGFAWAILEAMNASLPVIATSVGSAPEMIEHDVNGLLVKPCDPVAISKAIESVLEDKELVKTLGNNARITAQSEFSEQKMLEDIKKLLIK